MENPQMFYSEAFKHLILTVLDLVTANKKN